MQADFLIVHEYIIRKLFQNLIVHLTSKTNSLISIMKFSVGLYMYSLPAAAFEKKISHDGHDSFRKWHGDEHTGRPQMKSFHQHIGKRHLKHPKTKDVDPRRCARIAGTVKGIHQHHTHTKKDVARGDNAQGFYRNLMHIGLPCKHANDGIGKNKK